MGNCCGQEMGNNLELQLTQKSLLQTLNGNKKKSISVSTVKQNKKSLIKQQTVNFEVEKNMFTNLLNDILSRYNYIDLEYSTRESKLPKENLIEKLRMDQLYNITISHDDNFINSKYIVMDLRLSRKETFIKKFPQINYKIHELQIASNSLIKKVKKLTNLKKLIILIDKDYMIQEVEDIIVFMNKNNFNCTFKLLDNDLSKEASLSTFFLSDNLDKRINIHLPYIFANLQYFPHLGSSKLIFINPSIKFSSLTNKEFESNFFRCYDTDNFIEFFSLNSYLLITKKFSIKSLLNNLTSENLFLSHSTIIEGIETLNDIGKNFNLINEALNLLSVSIDEENSILILIDEDINQDVKDYLYYIFMIKLLKLPSKLIMSLFMDNPVFSESFKRLLDNKQDLLDEFYTKFNNNEKVLTVESERKNFILEELQNDEVFFYFS